jgi:hypothetical protein
MRSASGDDDLFDRRAADRAGIAAMAINLVLDLEIAAHTFSVHVIGDGRTAELDGALEDGLEGGAQAGVFGAGDACGLAARSNSGAKERLIRIDVADAVQE